MHVERQSLQLPENPNESQLAAHDRASRSDRCPGGANHARDVSDRDALQFDAFYATIAVDIAPKAAPTMPLVDRQEGRAETVIEFLQLKFGSLTDAQTSLVTTASPEQLSIYAARLLAAESVEAVLAD